MRYLVKDDLGQAVLATNFLADNRCFVLIETEEPANVAQALTWFAEGMDFADALHLSGSIELSGFATFDRKLALTAEKLDAIPSVVLIR